MLRINQESVHPHACGEHVCCVIHFFSHSGSSPRLWGTRNYYTDLSICGWFIPTPVGNTSPEPPALRRSPVHPHACGEHWRGYILFCPSRGSSPRLWGTRRSADGAGGGVRFIPTPVGNTGILGDLRMSWAVHPHACGGHVKHLFYSKEIAVHPHACGEHLVLVVVGAVHLGSSPRLWGTHQNSHTPANSSRFIPTPVGNTSHSFFTCSLMTVHPHACGEHHIICIPVDAACGSSPRLWGTQCKL